MTEPRAYTADEIIEAMAQLWCVGDLSKMSPFTKQAYLDTARTAYLVAKRMERVPTEKQIREICREFNASPISRGGHSHSVRAHKFATDARVAEIEAGQEGES